MNPRSFYPILRKAGFSEKDLPTAAAIMAAESGGNSRAHNTNAGTGDNSYGLFQINMLGAMGPERLARYGLSSNNALFNPLTNAKVAYQLSKGGSDWSPWSTYKSGAYQQYMNGAPASARAVTGPSAPPSMGPRPVTNGNDPNFLANLFARGAKMAGLDAPTWMQNMTVPQSAQGLPTAPVPVMGPSKGAVKGMVPQFKSALGQLISAVEARGGSLSITSGYRSPAEQARLFKDAVAKYGSESAARKWVAPPGKSNHNRGIAADLSGSLDLAAQLAPQFGLFRPMGWEPWHFELRA